MNKSFFKFVTDFGPLLIFFSFYYKNDKSLEIAIPLVLQHIDSPSTTSQITYGVYMSAHSGGTVWTNNHDRCIIAMELKG